MDARTAGTVRLERLATLALFAAVTAWTVATARLPAVRFNVHFPDARLALEVIGAGITGITVALAYLRYSLTGSRLWKWIAVAFVPIAINHLAFGVVVPTERLGVRHALYFWTAGRFVTAVLLLVGARRGPIAGGRPSHPARSFLALSGAAVAALAVLDGLLWAFRASLPPLSEVGGRTNPAEITGPLPELSMTVIVIELAGTALFLLATILYLRRRDPTDAAPPWLPPVLIVAAFAHVHYMLFPTVFTDFISTGDMLRLALALGLLLGLTYEVRTIFLRERAQARELSRAFASGRVRVQELEEIDRARAKLYGVLTHELLHPVAALRALSLLLSQRGDALAPEARRDIVENIEKETARLGTLAEGVSGAIQFGTEPFALVPQPESVAELVREAADATSELGGRLRVLLGDDDEELMVHADRTRVLQVFRNLLSNADKYAPDGSPVEIDVRRSDAEVTFRVSDRGPGIIPEEVPQLFHAFARVHRPGEDPVPGSGLGLYICRHIVDAHGGRIWVENRPEGGATFAFTLPRARRGSGDGSD
ncbi:MAG TPA: ATP-binding protein [Actinomycetota bacterium]|nr:ATP-binding protein [Actinomycetota bacterium]